MWDPTDETYRDPDTGLPLPTWDQALDDLEANPDAQPAVVMPFGTQLDIAASPDADRLIRYLVTYLTKSITETYTHPDHPYPG